MSKDPIELKLTEPITVHDNINGQNELVKVERVRLLPPTFEMLNQQRTKLIVRELRRGFRFAQASSLPLMQQMFTAFKKMENDSEVQEAKENKKRESEESPEKKDEIEKNEVRENVSMCLLTRNKEFDYNQFVSDFISYFYKSKSCEGIYMPPGGHSTEEGQVFLSVKDFDKIHDTDIEDMIVDYIADFFLSSWAKALK